MKMKENEITSNKSKKTYRILQEISEGAFGTVYKVAENNEIFAMKVIRRSKCKPNELLILNKIDSPFLIKLHDEIFDDDDAYFIITEFCEGLSLEHNINEKGNSGKTFDQNLIFDWMKDIIKGLSYLHDKLQIIHRDIKPGNILLTASGKIKIADFGLSRIIDSDSLSSEVGTFYYMSPEMLLDSQLSSTSYGPKTDIWSAGCVLFELITLKKYRSYIENKDKSGFCYSILKKLQSILKRMLLRSESLRYSSSDLNSLINVLENCEDYVTINNFDFENTEMPQNYLPTRIANFIGREDVLKQIDEEFFKNNKKVISLNSFSGTGKTTTAIEFGYRFVEKFKECFVYFMKSDRNNIDLEFKNFASECKIADLKSQDKKGLIGKVKEKLCELNEKVLFIFDNCDNLKSVGLYLSIISNLENVFFLITTSDENLSGDIDSLLQRGVASKRLLIEPFSKTESLQFLKNNLERKIQDENDLIEFLDLTGFSNSPIRPYILTRMVAYVKLKTGETIRLKSFNNDLKSKKVLKENVYEGNEMFDTLIKRDKEAWNLLKYSSFLNPDFVPTDIYIDILELDGDTLDKSIRRLRELSLINVDNNDEGVKVHRALQIETKQYLSSTKEDEFNQIKNQLTEKLTNVLKKEFKEQREKKWNAKKYYYNFKMIIENINVLDGQLDDDTARLFSLFGKYLRKFELNYQECLGFYENSLSFYKIKEDEPVIADCLKNIGETYFSLGHGYYEKALDYFEQSILLNKKLKDHENIANNLHNIGMVNIDIGEYEKALDNFENALRIKKEIFPNTISKSIADTLHIIGRACSRIGKYRKSIEYHEQALLIYENLKEDSDIATELKHMGLVYNYTGEYEKAIDSYKKSIEINRKVLDQDNSNIAYTCICLANVYVNSKSYEQAEQFNKEGFKILNMLPKDRYFDYSTALYYANIGSINMHIGKSDLALEFSEKALKLFQDLFPKDKIIYIGQIMNNIGLVYLNKKNFEKAKIYLHNSLQVYMQLFKDNEPNLSIAQAYENMAKYHETLGNKPEALKIRSEMYTKH